MTEHTGLPWQVTQSVFETPGLYFIHEAAAATAPQNIANAEFIERAVNSHYELLAACKDAAHTVSGECPLLDAAIAKAEADGAAGD